MNKITSISGLVIPLNMRDVDTDLIIPAQFLTQVTKEGYGQALFYRLRENNPDFIFNQPQFKAASILVAGDNFGCGSSREHAVWALMEAGIKVVIASSFSDIFSSNAAKNGLVLIQLAENTIQKMLQNALTADYFLTIDIAKECITTNLNEEFNFKLNSFHKYCFLNGLDELDYLLSHSKEIKTFNEHEHEKIYSTVFNGRSRPS